MRPERSEERRVRACYDEQAVEERLTFIIASFADEVAILVDLGVFAEPLAIKVALCTGHG